jgi:hypothetical protein
LEVRECGNSGVIAGNGACITLVGANSTVHHNCTSGKSDKYGLQVSGSSSSTIQLDPPLTREQVSIANGGGGNWGAEYDGNINQIKTIVPSNALMKKTPVSLCFVLFVPFFLFLIIVSDLFRSVYSVFSMLVYRTVGVGGGR